ncbi:MAG: hypothetical protein M3P18_06150 [Actinomycetota bacterium]|nr:hypothetical protein [Actinomycetota bacterium]
MTVQFRDLARGTLASVRIFNGTAGLLWPAMLARRLDVEDAAGPMAYPFRMFGIRTILIGADLFATDPAVRQHARRAAVIVHASDTVSSIVAGRTGALPRRAATTTTAVSAVNLVLALAANWPEERP